MSDGTLSILDEAKADHVDLLVINIGQLCTVHAPEVEDLGPRRRQDMGRRACVSMILTWSAYES